jgi:beta-phosphoglucomutase
MQHSHKKYKAFLFDLNGTMIDDMQYHIEAWHRILNDLGASISIKEVKEECYGKNHELLERIFPGRYTYEEKDRLSYDKEIRYQEQFRPRLRLIEGLGEFLKEAHEAGIRIAIGSAAITFNIDFVLDGLDIRSYVDVVVSADHVEHSKPHPETFIKCAQKLGLSPGECLIFEDAPKGAESALRAGMDCVVITTLHEPEEFAGNESVIGFIDDYQNDFVRSFI